MKRIILMCLCVVIFASCLVHAQPKSKNVELPDPFHKKYFKRFDHPKFNFYYQLPRKFRVQKKTADAVYYKRVKPDIYISVNLVGEPQMMNAAQFKRVVQDVYDNLWLEADNFYKDGAPVVFTGPFGMNGYVFKYVQWGAKLTEYHWFFYCLLDGKGQMYTIMVTANADDTALCGTETAIYLYNDTIKTMRRPLAAGEELQQEPPVTDFPELLRAKVNEARGYIAADQK